MTNWQDDMNRAAARIAFPDLELQEGDEITLTMYASEGWAYSTYTYDSASCEITVSVSRNRTSLGYKDFTFEDAQRFFMALMNYKEDA